ncbi:pyridoxal phosphate-dependent transferase [Xylariaceae sp. FL0662B]|nr:pyridoxal phosphate-dependent transferase [Xylariaceae sp. FL0662B]
MNSIPRPPVTNVLVTRSITNLTPETRESILRSVGYNVFAFPAALLVVDFLSDSGTTAMTDIQWAAMLRGDESYGRNTGYYCLLEALRDIFERGEQREYAFRRVLLESGSVALYKERLLKQYEGGFVNGGTAQMLRPNTFIVPQARCAENLLFSTMKDSFQFSEKSSSPIILGNGFFDTTRANARVAGFDLMTFTQPGLTDHFPPHLLHETNPFKGNMDIGAASGFLSSNNDTSLIALIIVTITNNWAGGQPVSMANIRAVSKLASTYGLPLFFDACRFAENAKFIKDFEHGYQSHTIPQIVQEMFSFADGFTISFKKDALANMGGALCIRDEGVFARRYPGIGLSIREQQILRYGNDSYGGMSGRDLMAASVGLYEGTKNDYLSARIEQVREFAQKLIAAEVPVLLPPGGSAVFLDMDEFFKGSERPHGEFAALGFTLKLLSSYGIRAFESGPFAWEWDKIDDKGKAETPNLVRFAIPRNVMGDRHLDFTVAAIKRLYQRRDTIPGVRIIHGQHLSLRHFQSVLEPIPANDGHSQDDE